jgi:hypothetical protein
MSDDKKREYTGHRPPDEVKVIVGEQAGHRAPGDLPVKGSGHPAPSRLDPVNVAPQTPPPKRDDAGSSGKPPAK